MLDATQLKTKHYKYRITKEDPWTWMIIPEQTTKFKFEVYNTGTDYEITLLEKHGHNQLNPYAHTTVENKIEISGAIEDLENDYAN